MTKKIVIPLTEVSRKGDNILNKPMLLNIDYLVAAQEAELQKSDVPIIGQGPMCEDVTAIMLGTGRNILVRETVTEINSLISAAQLR